MMQPQLIIYQLKEGWNLIEGLVNLMKANRTHHHMLLVRD